MTILMSNDLREWYQGLTPDARQKALENPVTQPPSGVEVAVGHGPNNNPLGFGVLITASILIVFLVGGKLYARVVCQKSVTLEDYLAVAALGVYGAFAWGVWGVGTSPGFFVDFWNLTLKDYLRYLYFSTVNYALFTLIVALLKIGILLQWIRLFVPANRGFFWWICHTTILFNVVADIAVIILTFTRCTPVPAAWDITIDGSCSMLSIYSTFFPPFINLLTDVIILLLPHMIVWRLKLPMPKKLGIAALFAIGIFATIAGAFRLSISLASVHNGNATQLLSKLSLWSVAEVTAQFFVLCVSSFPPLCKKMTFIGSLATRLGIKSKVQSSHNDNAARWARRGLQSWPRRPRRDPDASLFTEVAEFGLAPTASTTSRPGSDPDFPVPDDSRSSLGHAKGQQER
ncbi:hypothetical protein EJ04DRAFT_561850 [Polyplosphaeria fusca]|uniref:Rhodopsin domain-containing protein n=1 Tax=Polyplosphaeria fusca TaxID=682080 RepID=A0A9P4R237_9PLEO|nr:hypothetical protein EJ04DRAFT_561850 [Polyplosphaeria fusca]